MGGTGGKAGQRRHPQAMHIKQFVVNHFQVNCFVVWDEALKECAIIDPGMEQPRELEAVERFIADGGLKPAMVLLTHAHIDHIAGLEPVCRRYGLPVTMHRDGEKLLAQAELYGSMMGFAASAPAGLERRYVEDNDRLTLGGGDQHAEIEVRLTPGHCPGSATYVLHADKAAFTGDALFRGSIGRTDLPGGDYPLLIDKIKTRILTLPEDYAVIPGHGDTSTVGEELLYNGFVQ